MHIIFIGTTAPAVIHICVNEWNINCELTFHLKDYLLLRYELQIQNLLIVLGILLFLQHEIGQMWTNIFLNFRSALDSSTIPFWQTISFFSVEDQRGREKTHIFTSNYLSTPVFICIVSGFSNSIPVPACSTVSCWVHCKSCSFILNVNREGCTKSFTV